ncbi:MAG: hypothetical protein P8P26_03835 [Porticoccaceae bacterium]|nr:hypothetical protein [Porticoccaceae bacterium]
MSNPFVLDLRALALMRIGVGLLLLADIAIRAPDVVIWLTDSGVLSRERSIGYSSEWRFSLYWLNGGVFWASLLMAVAAGFAALLTLGVRTRLASIVSFVLLVSLHNRNPMLLQGGDNLLLLMVFWGCFLPWGERASFDSAMVKNPQESNRYFSASSIGLVLQVLSVYFFSALLKTGDEWVENGTAIYYALHNDQFAFGLARYWREWHDFTWGLTHYVWWLELLAPILALVPLWFVRLRTLAVMAFIALEIGFIFNLRIGLFPYISIVSLFAILPIPVMDRLWSAPKSTGPALKMYFDKDCSFCEKTCYLLRAILGLARAEISAAQDHKTIGAVLERENSWVVINEQGLQYLRWDALSYVVQCSPRFGGASRLLQGFGRFGDRIYNWIGEHRYGFGRATAFLLPWRNEHPRIGTLGSISAGVITVLLIWQNISSIKQWNPIHGFDTGILEGSSVPAPDFFKPWYRGLRLDQRWAMFAPWPQKNDGWFITPGLLSDGRLVAADAENLRPPLAERPNRFAGQFKNYRWRKYLGRLWLKRYSKYRTDYGAWVCRDWNNRHYGADQLQALDFYFIRSKTQPPGQQTINKPYRLMRYHCFEKALLETEPVRLALKRSGDKKLIQTLGIE